MDKTKQQLNHIINDDLYWSYRSTSFKDVLISINGRKSLSQKQRDVIDKAIKTYTRYRLKRSCGQTKKGKPRSENTIGSTDII